MTSIHIIKYSSIERNIVPTFYSMGENGKQYSKSSQSQRAHAIASHLYEISRVWRVTER